MKNQKILLDTDILIELLRGNEVVTECLVSLLTEKKLLAYTAVTEAELFHGIRSKKEEKNLLETLSIFVCLDLTKEVGQQAGYYLYKYRKSHGVELADALIAAAAKVYQFSLSTFNWKHYPMKEIKKFEMKR